MNKQEIDQLLQKYWDAETSVAEERTLSAYFNSGNVDASHKSLAPMFEYFSIEQEHTTSNIDIDKIDFNQDHHDKNRFGHFGFSPFQMGIAASFIALLAIISGLRISNQDQEARDTYASNIIIYDEDQEMEEAYQVTREALSLLSSKLKSSQKRVSENLNEFKKVDLLN